MLDCQTLEGLAFFGQIFTHAGSAPTGEMKRASSAGRRGAHQRVSLLDLLTARYLLSPSSPTYLSAPAARLRRIRLATSQYGHCGPSVHCSPRTGATSRCSLQHHPINAGAHLKSAEMDFFWWML